MQQNYVKRTIIMHSKKPHVCNIPSDEALDAMTELSSGAFKLLVYYYSKFTGWNFDDREIASTLGVSERRLKQIRKELVASKYLLIQKGNVDIYFIGRTAVSEWGLGAISSVPVIVEDQDGE